MRLRLCWDNPERGPDRMFVLGIPWVVFPPVFVHSCAPLSLWRWACDGKMPPGMDLSAPIPTIVSLSSFVVLRISFISHPSSNEYSIMPYE